MLRRTLAGSLSGIFAGTVPRPQLIGIIDRFAGKRELNISDREELELCEID
jgi:hypothetical protein